MLKFFWMKQILCDFGLKFDSVPILCNNTRTKHIDIRHHFIREQVQKRHIILDFVNSNNQLADIFTKPLNEEKFCKNRLVYNLL